MSAKQSVKIADPNAVSPADLVAVAHESGSLDFLKLTSARQSAARGDSATFLSGLEERDEAAQKIEPIQENLKVLKFGGTSVKSIGRIQHVCDLIAAQCKKQKLIVVVSAMGDTTDALLKLANQCSKTPDQRELDLLLSTGEQISIALLSLALNDRGIKAKSFTGLQLGILTDDNYNSARIKQINRAAIASAIEENDVIVVAGFQGYSESGDITTLGRGGSDTSAVALAVAAGVKECEIYTDVDGIYTTDPNVVPTARFIEQLSYDETLRMAYLGAQVIHPRSVELAKKYEVALRVRNTFTPNCQGTLITTEAENPAVAVGYEVSGVALDKSFSEESARISLVGRNLDNAKVLITQLIKALDGVGVKLQRFEVNALSISCFIAPEEVKKSAQVIHDQCILANQVEC